TAREKPATASYGEPEEMTRLSIGLVSRRVEALAQVDGWGAGAVAVAVLRGGDVIAERGPRDREFRWASITKPAVALATLVAAEEGVVDLDEPAGPEGSAVRHLLALVAPETLAEMTSVQFAGLNGVLPDVGRFDPNDWGLGVELRDSKQPHWTGTCNSEQTFGHFGGSGTFLWIDPAVGLALACL